MTQGQLVNAGGILSPEDIVGRDGFIKTCWRILETQGLYITGERRMGKTSVLRDKMGSAPQAGYGVVYLDVSDADTPLAFVEGLLGKAKELDSGARLKFGALDVFRRLAPGLEIMKVVKLPESLSPNWKELLRAILADFANSQTRLILAFDEMPLMLDKIKRNTSQGESVAMDLLDTLRKERQSDKRLRMIYTGSLGLHHILSALENANYQNAPINDLKTLEVGPLSEEFATELAHRLLVGMDVSCGDPEALALHIARITDGMPFYIQNLVGDLALSIETCTPEIADRLLTQRLRDLSDPWDLGYYKRRIDTHYQAANIPIALGFLDQLALTENPLTLVDLRAGLDPQKGVAEEEAALRTMELLGKDHYITQDEDGAFQFRYPLIARAWVYKRSLSRGKRA